jgi:hypothetical protein
MLIFGFFKSRNQKNKSLYFTQIKEELSNYRLKGLYNLWD